MISTVSEATVNQGPLEGENFEVHRGREQVPILIFCEHAGRAVPADIDLGISPDLLDSHWGWDRWARDTLLSFAPALGATTLTARVSRLVIDLNRGTDEATLILPDAGGAPIPGNQGLSPEQVAARVDRLYTPYHEAADAELVRLCARFPRERIVFFTFHTFTGDFDGQDREFDVGVLFDAHEDLAAGVKRALATAGLRVRLNEPYSGFRGEIYSAAVHAEAHDVPYFEIEVNQGVLEDPERRAEIGRIFAKVVPAIFPHLPSRPG
jgi:predicted N-formylglutamate amidohydrolase